MEAALRGLRVDVRIKSSLSGGSSLNLPGFWLKGKLVDFAGGYAVVDANTNQVLFRLPCNVQKINKLKPLYEDVAICVTISGRPDL